MSSGLIIAITTAVLGLVAAVTGYGIETKTKRLVYIGASIILFLIAIGTGYDEYRGWDLSEKQTKALKKFACTTRPKFPFYVFDLGSVPETNTYAIHIRDAFRACEWPVSLFPGDGYLRQDEVGVAVVLSPGNAENETIKNMANLLSRALCVAAIDHIVGTHTRLDETTIRIGIVVRRRPSLLRHFLGYGVQCDVSR